MATAQSILALRKQLIAATGESQNTEDAVIILKRLKEEVVATDELLRETKIGVTVNKLRNNTAKEVADLAKELVRKWKADVGKTGTKKTSTAAASTSGGPPRTHKTDGVEFGKGKDATGDKTREKCCELIYDALAQDSGARAYSHLHQRDQTKLTLHSGSATYRNKMRSFYLNLKAANNPGLREGIVSGEISIVQLYNMDPKDMASEERKAENRKLVAENLFKAQAAAPQQAETDAFQCGKCKQRRCMYYQMQTRSADEPMTTFVTCLSCNNRWKFS
ncbi:transcription factor S-II, central domain-containing protein [Rhodotorula toruloides]